MMTQTHPKKVRKLQILLRATEQPRNCMNVESPYHLGEKPSKRGLRKYF